MIGGFFFRIVCQSVTAKWGKARTDRSISLSIERYVFFAACSAVRCYCCTGLSAPKWATFSQPQRNQRGIRGDTFFFPVKFNERLAIDLGRGRAIKREWGRKIETGNVCPRVCNTKTEPFGLPVAGCARCMIYKLVINFQPLACRGYCAVCAARER